jgi:hypothetical protein
VIWVVWSRWKTRGAVVEFVVQLVILAALLIFVLLWALFFAGFPVEPVLKVCMGIAGTAVGLHSIGEALFRHWERGWWKPPPGQHATVRVGRLSSLGFGLWFGAVGVALLGNGWLPDYSLSGILGALGAGFVLMMVGIKYDRRRAEVARAAVRRRGWLMASNGQDDDLPAAAAREELCRSIQHHLRGRTTPERVEEQHRYLVGGASDAGSARDWPGVAEEWRSFRSAFAENDEIWEFNTVSARLGPVRGQEGFARLRDGTVVDWFITASSAEGVAKHLV